MWSSQSPPLPRPPTPSPREWGAWLELGCGAVGVGSLPGGRGAALCPKSTLRRGVPSGFSLRLAAKCQAECRAYTLRRRWPRGRAARWPRPADHGLPAELAQPLGLSLLLGGPGPPKAPASGKPGLDRDHSDFTRPGLETALQTALGPLCSCHPPRVSEPEGTLAVACQSPSLCRRGDGGTEGTVTWPRAPSRAGGPRVLLTEA